LKWGDFGRKIWWQKNLVAEKFEGRKIWWQKNLRAEKFEGRKI
jgi:hypothetical protein